MGDGTEFIDEDGVPTTQGEMADVDIGPDLSQVRKIKLRGLFQNPNRPVIFEKVEVDVPRPQFFKATDDSGDANAPRSLEEGDSADAWYGEEVGNGSRSVSIIANADGDLVASMTDGEVSYVIESGGSRNRKLAAGDGPPGPKKLKYQAVKLADLPVYDDENMVSGDNDNVRRQLSSSLRGAAKVDIKGESIPSSDGEEGRNLQSQECHDVAGFFGEWYDRDGPTYNCAWYASDPNYCSWFGNNYENFGLTANQVRILLK